MSFEEWLIKEKGFTAKSAHDTRSRLKRVYTIIGTDSVGSETIGMLVNNMAFSQLSVSVKSQLRRTIKLYVEFRENVCGLK